MANLFHFVIFGSFLYFCENALSHLYTAAIEVCIRVVNFITDKINCGKLIAFHYIDLFNVFGSLYFFCENALSNLYTAAVEVCIRVVNFITDIINIGKLIAFY